MLHDERNRSASLHRLWRRTRFPARIPGADEPTALPTLPDFATRRVHLRGWRLTRLPPLWGAVRFSPCSEVAGTTAPGRANGIRPPSTLQSAQGTGDLPCLPKLPGIYASA